MAYKPLQNNFEFLHPVGLSTLRQGITIPVEAQTERLLAIDKGSKVPVTILFGDNKSVIAEIRRLNNKVGQLQFRYENKGQQPLREFFSAIFSDNSEGNLLEIIELSPFTCLFRPILKSTAPHLQINDISLHKIEKKIVSEIDEVSEIKKLFCSIEYDSMSSQSEYNGRIREALTTGGWKSE